jgi:hypothetical protein
MAVYRVRLADNVNHTRSNVEVAQAGSLNAGYKAELFFEATQFPAKGTLGDGVPLLRMAMRESAITGVKATPPKRASVGIRGV